jgi:hypothetical protein
MLMPLIGRMQHFIVVRSGVYPIAWAGSVSETDGVAYGE